MHVSMVRNFIWLILVIMAFIMSCRMLILARIDPQEGIDEMIRAVYPDGSQGPVTEFLLVKLIGQGNVVAFQPFEDWIELRCKATDVYRAERRINALEQQEVHSP